MRLTDAEKAVLVLTTRLGDKSRPSYPPAAWSKLHQQVRDAGSVIEDVFGDMSSLSLGEDDRTRVEGLVSDGAAAMLEVDQLDQRGIWTLTVESEGYPEALTTRLDRVRPPVLFGAGDRSLLHAPGVGIVGSRNVTDEGANVARAMARAACAAGHAVVSGAARGVDQLAMEAAYEAGGNVVGVLADALTKRVRSGDVLSALDGGVLSLVTQQHPDAGFSAGAAMARNKLIYALSTVTVVIATDEGSGGTWAGATEALTRGNGTVAVWRGPGEGPGNAALQERGAVGISDPKDLGSLLSGEPIVPPEQLSFID